MDFVAIEGIQVGLVLLQNPMLRYIRRVPARLNGNAVGPGRGYG